MVNYNHFKLSNNFFQDQKIEKQFRSFLEDTINGYFGTIASNTTLWGDEVQKTIISSNKFEENFKHGLNFRVKLYAESQNDYDDFYSNLAAEVKNWASENLGSVNKMNGVNFYFTNESDEIILNAIKTESKPVITPIRKATVLFHPRHNP